MLKIKNNLHLNGDSKHMQLSMPYIILQDAKKQYWLMPFKTPVIVVKPVVKEGRVQLTKTGEVKIVEQKIYDITDWMADDNIDETVEMLIQGTRLKKFDTELVTGLITIAGGCNANTGECKIDIQSDMNLPFTVINYALSGYLTNHTR